MTSRSRPGPRVHLMCGGLGGLAVWFGVSVLSSRIGAQVPIPVSYTAAQADQGQAAYVEHCESCHGPNMDDGTFAPPLKGVDFRVKWGLRPTEALFTFTSTKMPPDRPGALGDKSYAEVVAYIFQENGSRPGARELLVDAASLKAIGAPDWPRPGGGGIAPGVTIPPPPVVPNPLDRIRPVTDAMLTTPPAGDWLSWRRTYDASSSTPREGRPPCCD